jgi:hypothetical protein
MSVLLHLETAATSLLSRVMKFKYNVIDNLITWSSSDASLLFTNLLAFHSNIFSKHWWKWRHVLRDPVVRMKNPDYMFLFYLFSLVISCWVGQQKILNWVASSCKRFCTSTEHPDWFRAYFIGDRMACLWSYLRISICAALKNAWRFTSTPSYVFMVWCLIKRHKTSSAFLSLGWRSGRCMIRHCVNSCWSVVIYLNGTLEMVPFFHRFSILVHTP